MKAIETLVDFVLLRGHYTAGGDRGKPGWDACARVQPLMADGVGTRVCGAAADGRGSSKEKGRRGEDPRNREDHPVTLVTDRGEPLHARVAPSNANLLVSPCQLDDYHAARKKYSSWKTGNERNAYAHNAREREFRYHSAMRIALVPVAGNGEKLARTDSGCTLSMQTDCRPAHIFLIDSINGKCTLYRLNWLVSVVPCNQIKTESTERRPYVKIFGKLTSIQSNTRIKHVFEMRL